MTGFRQLVGVCALALFVAGITAAGSVGDNDSPTASGGLIGVETHAGGAVEAVEGGEAPAEAPEAAAAAAPEEAAGPVPMPLSGCPPPPRRAQPGTGGQASWRPPVLVPEDELPEALPPTELVADMAPIRGKGMWVWKHLLTEGGDAQAIVDRAVAAGLSQLWVRVADSRDGFYGADFLAALVPKAHARGLAVIGWGFPYLWDPVGDAAWTAEVVAWRGPDGASLDAFSPDIEMSSEGVVLTETRARVYLGLVRQAAGRRMVVATVYRPTDAKWAEYPYQAMAPYVDAFAPMVYWGCTEPGEATAQALERLAPLRPVHVIGQGYDMADEGGRDGPPDAAETRRFLDVAHRGGAIGASFWVWQSMDDSQWSALADYRWPPLRPHR